MQVVWRALDVPEDPDEWLDLTEVEDLSWPTVQSVGLHFPPVERADEAQSGEPNSSTMAGAHDWCPKMD